MLLRTNKLAIGYKKTAVQSGLNLQLDEGELVCLIGANGCGKSTLLRTLAGLQKQLGGEILYGDRRLELLNANERALILSFVLAESIEVDQLSVFDLVFTGRYPHTGWLGNKSNLDIEKTEHAIAMVQLSHKKNCFINELSDGEKQRAMIAKALAQDTPFVILDEPTAHLDLPNRAAIILLLRKLAKETNKAFLLSTHDLDLAIQSADTIWLMVENGIKTGQASNAVLLENIQKAFSSDDISIDPKTGACKLTR